MRRHIRIDEFIDRVGRKAASIGIDQETMDGVVFETGENLEAFIFGRPAVQFVVVKRYIVGRHSKYPGLRPFPATSSPLPECVAAAGGPRARGGRLPAPACRRRCLA